MKQSRIVAAVFATQTAAAPALTPTGTATPLPTVDALLDDAVAGSARRADAVREGQMVARQKNTL